MRYDAPVVYRDRADDPEIARLQAMVATRRELLAERARVRHEHDRVAREADIKGRELADAEEGGALAKVSAWLTGSERDRELALLRGQASELDAQLERLVAEERVLDGKLAALDGAERELEQRKAARAEVLRTQGGPIADELRGIDNAIANDDARLDDLDDAFAAHQRAETLVVEVSDQMKLLRGASGIGFAVERFSIDGAQQTVSVPVLRARLHDLLPMAQNAIAAFLVYVDARDDISTHMAAQQLAHLARAEIDDRPEDSPLAFDVGSAATCLERLLAKLLEIRDETRSHRAELVAQRRSIEDSSAG